MLFVRHGKLRIGPQNSDLMSHAVLFVRNSAASAYPLCPFSRLEIAACVSLLKEKQCSQKINARLSVASLRCFGRVGVTNRAPSCQNLCVCMLGGHKDLIQF